MTGMRRHIVKWTRATAVAMILMSRSTAADDLPVHEIHVVASTFAFDPPTIEVTAGEPVRLTIRSKDRVHGFSIPRLKIDQRIPKGGESVVVEFVAPAPGRYEIACSEFCGSGHGQMKAALVSTPSLPKH